MGLARLAELALALNRRGGSGYLANTAQVQTLVPYIAGGSVSRQTITPPQDSYAAIGYSFTLGDPYPFAFTVRLQNYGIEAFNFVVPPGPQSSMPLDVWIVTLTRSPLTMVVTNSDTVAHPFASTMNYLLIQSTEDYNELMKRLELEAIDEVEAEALENMRRLQRLCIGGVS